MMHATSLVGASTSPGMQPLKMEKTLGAALHKRGYRLDRPDILARHEYYHAFCLKFKPRLRGYFGGYCGDSETPNVVQKCR